VSYSINVRWDHGQGPRYGNCEEWGFGWYGSEQAAEEAARDSLQRSNADRVEIWRGSEATTPRGTIIREIQRPTVARRQDKEER
jgi:hypothetical protein